LLSTPSPQVSVMNHASGLIVSSKLHYWGGGASIQNVDKQTHLSDWNRAQVQDWALVWDYTNSPVGPRNIKSEHMLKYPPTGFPQSTFLITFLSGRNSHLPKYVF
jgi:hypothetical protein